MAQEPQSGVRSYASGSGFINRGLWFRPQAVTSTCIPTLLGGRAVMASKNQFNGYQITRRFVTLLYFASFIFKHMSITLCTY
jgi:hypothetical protein